MKNVLLLLLALIVSQSVFSQEDEKKDKGYFKHQTGFGLSIYNEQGYAVNGTFCIYSRYHFRQISKSSSLSANAGLGFGFPGIALGGFIFSQFLQINVPLTINYNLGFGAGKNDEDKSAGLYIGAGAGFDYTSDFTNKFKTFGPVIQGGFRFGGRSGSPFDIKFSLLKSVNTNGTGVGNILTMNLFYGFK